MLVLQTVWVEIRGEFTVAEMQALRGAAVGETICPRGLHIDVDALALPLAEKLTSLVLGRTRKSHT